jgi:S1-C subfamily serine protease
MRRNRPGALALGALAALVVLALISGFASRTRSTSSAPVASPETLQSRYVDTVRTVSRSVVEVETPVGLGSGVVFDRKGDIITNDHVVGSDKRFTVVDSAGKRYRATLVGAFVPDDLAVINVANANLPPAAFGDSSKLAAGDIVLAVGNPLGYQSSVTQGIVSALGRTLTEQNGSALPALIQTSAAINPGNSGGALVNLEGAVVGIPTLSAIDSETSQLANSIGFAIPSNTAKAIAAQLIRYGHVVNSGRAYLGAQIATTLSGDAIVLHVTPKGPAANAGVRAGDIIASIDDHAVQSSDDLAAILANLKPAQKVPLTVRTPNGRSSTLRITLGQYPAS